MNDVTKLPREMEYLSWTDKSLREEVANILVDSESPTMEFGFYMPLSNPMYRIFPKPEAVVQTIRVGDIHGIAAFLSSDVPEGEVQLRHESRIVCRFDLNAQQDLTK